jgi:hypothetical protein
MKYKVRRQGENLGEFSLEELTRRRETGEFSGGEYVQLAGALDWQPLDSVIQHGYRTAPSTPPPLATGGLSNPAIIWGLVLFGFVLMMALVFFFARVATQERQRAYQRAYNFNSRQYSNRSHEQPVAVASQPVVWTTNTSTMAEASLRARDFRTRQWLDGYEQRGQRNPECDAEVVKFMETWIARNYGGSAATNDMSLNDESEKLSEDTNCTDPLVLTAVASCAETSTDAIRQYKRALKGFKGSHHKAYPEFNANIELSARLQQRVNSGNATVAYGYEAAALPLLRQCFQDGSFTTNDQQEIAEIFINNWGYNFFWRHAPEVCAIVHDAGPGYRWLALTLDGEHEIIAAWAARGGGYANTVTEPGWQSFNSHLAAARTDLTEAWNSQPMWPLAPERMIYVSLGDSDINEMRLWFDRTTTAQIDYNRAWTDFRWGLRPRWYGNEASLLAIGVAAVNTGRFDTDVPRKYIDAIYDVESEIGESSGEHIFGRADIWPNLQRMYDGYLAAPSQTENRAGWRTSYAVVAYFAGKYDVTRTQLEALDWQPVQQNLAGWGVDLSQMSLEVAARTGPLGVKISAVESLRTMGNTSDALAEYKKIENSDADDRTHQFVTTRIKELQLSLQLEKGQWVDFLPAKNDDPNWNFNLGQFQVLADGALQAKSAPNGHVAYCSITISTNFEVRGQFETVQTSGKNYFQAGLDFGDTSQDRNNWFSFRIRRGNGDSVSIGRGWSRSEIHQQATLNDTTNAFDFIFQNGLVTASVNGGEIFHQARLPAEFSEPRGTLTLGLGALTREGAIIRYRNIQVRNLN